jgi:hypothetical protein
MQEQISDRVTVHLSGDETLWSIFLDGLIPESLEYTITVEIDGEQQQRTVPAIYAAKGMALERAKYVAASNP